MFENKLLAPDSRLPAPDVKPEIRLVDPVVSDLPEAARPIPIAEAEAKFANACCNAVSCATCDCKMSL